jgi:4-hydroxybenzoate polyprenyltransferase
VTQPKTRAAPNSSAIGASVQPHDQQVPSGATASGAETADFGDASGASGAQNSAPSSVFPSITPSLLVTSWGVLRTMRPHQWVKNVFVLAPVVFAKEVFEHELLLRAFGAFAVFCLLAGAVYTMNDLVDMAADRQHPVKRFRPIASGAVPKRIAIISAALLVASALGFAAIGPLSFLLVAAGYFAINVGYSFGLKHIAYLDVGIIALGFVLRVQGGGFATDTPVSVYIVACTALLALFLGFGKRRHELASAEERKKRGKAQRPVLESYSQRGLDIALVLTAMATIATYVIYTLDPRTREYFQSDYLWLTSGFVVLGVARFLHLVRHRPHAESPTQEMLKDGPFVGVVLLWVMIVMWMVYNLQPTG